jgi:protein-S-isoprenylcysteine O-methyltransferase Ste14
VDDRGGELVRQVLGKTALAGTAVALSWLWLTAVVLAGVYFLYGATVEERYMTEQFPDDYSAYKRLTKMLVPF